MLESFACRCHRLNVRLGNIFFHYRNALFPVVLAAFLAFFRPTQFLKINHPAADAWYGAAALFLILGEGLRLLTIGYRYIDRGGKNRRIFASRLVTEGVYRHVRNPMYVGNMLIVMGLAMLSGSFPLFVAASTLFLFIYQSIATAEENYLARSFGDDFRRYTKTVPRFIPNFRGIFHSLAPIPFQWRRTLRKDYGNVLVVVLGFLLLPLWRNFYWNAEGLPRGTVMVTSLEVLLAVSVYLFIRHLKKAGYLADQGPEVVNPIEIDNEEFSGTPDSTSPPPASSASLAYKIRPR